MWKTNIYLFFILSLSPVLFAYDSFSSCKDQLIERAIGLKISPQLVNSALAPIQPIKKTLALDSNQPEFTKTFEHYFNMAVNEIRITQGKKLLKKHKKLLNSLTKKYGTPAHYLVALWGLETNYGRTMGSFPILNTVVTLACDKRRSNYFSNEVMATLQLLETHNLPIDEMLGSWAGAMGHTQFMPSTYLRHGINGDKNKQINLWNSIPDALTSAANYLSSIGWKREWKWGREVKIPKNFDFKTLDLEEKLPLSKWRELGITNVFGKKMAQSDEQAQLLIPSGHTGPAFLVYDNYHIILQWNRSVFYAIAVGHLADRINGAIPLKYPPLKQDYRLTRDHIKKLQQELYLLGFLNEKPDGYVGPLTRKAIKAFEISKNILPDGYPDREVFISLDISLLESITQ